MPNLTKTVPLNQDVLTQVYEATSWEQVTFIHTGDTNGPLFITVQNSKGESGAFELPINVPVGPLLLMPGTKIQALSLSDNRDLGIFMSPMPFDAALLRGVYEMIGTVIQAARTLLGTRPAAPAISAKKPVYDFRKDLKEGG